MDAIVEATRPIDGTQDTEASRAAIRDSLSDLLDRFPSANLLALSQEEREFAIERYVALDVYRRFDLDLGKSIRERAPTALIALTRLKQAREYIRETIAAAFRDLRAGGATLTGATVASLVLRALSDAFEVFEEYAE